MKKFLRNIDKHKNEQNNKSSEKAISKLTTMRGILKDGRCGPECTGDSSVQGTEEYNTGKANYGYVTDIGTLSQSCLFCLPNLVNQPSSILIQVVRVLVSQTT